MNRLSTRRLRRRLIVSGLVGAASIATTALIAAPPRRSPPPSYSDQQIGDVFFKSLQSAMGGERPSVQALRELAAKQQAAPESDTGSRDRGAVSGLVSAATLESEVKRVKLRFDGNVASPGVVQRGRLPGCPNRFEHFGHVDGSDRRLRRGGPVEIGRGQGPRSVCKIGRQHTGGEPPSRFANPSGGGTICSRCSRARGYRRPGRLNRPGRTIGP